MKRVLFACLLFGFSLALASGQSITVTKPAADETWVKGQSHMIQWTKQGTMPDTVRIVLWDSEMTALVQVIVNSAPNTGSFNWAVPSSLADGRYRIKVKASGAPIEDLSGIFAIGSSSEGLHPRLQVVQKEGIKLQAAPSVKVLKPSSADAYHQLDTITIQVQANTGPADGSGDGFDLDLYNETGTARVTDILSGAMTQTVARGLLLRLGDAAHGFRSRREIHDPGPELEPEHHRPERPFLDQDPRDRGKGRGRGRHRQQLELEKGALGERAR